MGFFIFLKEMKSQNILVKSRWNKSKQSIMVLLTGIHDYDHLNESMTTRPIKRQADKNVLVQITAVKAKDYTTDPCVLRQVELIQWGIDNKTSAGTISLSCCRQLINILNNLLTTFHKLLFVLSWISGVHLWQPSMGVSFANRIY